MKNLLSKKKEKPVKILSEKIELFHQFDGFSFDKNRAYKKVRSSRKSQLILKKLSLNSMLNYLHSAVSIFPDKRTGKNLTFSMEDAGIGAFSIFFMQSPSFLAFQKAMEKNKGIFNSQSLFFMDKIPCDNHIRSLLDEVPPALLFPVFLNIISDLKALGYLDSFRSYGNNLLCALDGTQYFTSDTIHCDKCTIKEHKNGKISYSHTAITPVFVAPGNNKVIPLPPEFITPQDGSIKQDCENTAAKRWLIEYGALLKAFGTIILGDDLYCKQPLSSLIAEQGLHFILVCKPDSHKTLYQWVEELQSMNAVETLTVKRWTGKTHLIDTYRFVNDVPLRDGQDAMKVNWCEITTTLPDGTIDYKNAFVTDFIITNENIKQIVTDGRARWKVENENNNVLKNRGYHLEHNFGHGKNHLSQHMLTLNILSFLFHTVLEYTDPKYLLVRNNLESRQTFFEHIRCLTRYINFESWDHLLTFMISGLELEMPDTS